MKLFAVTLTMLLMLLTLATPNLAFAQEESTSRLNVDEEAPPTRLSDLDMHLNPQLGVSSLAASGSSTGRAQFSGGATVEFGGPARKLETGLLILQTASTVSENTGANQQLNVSYLTLPLLAKLRIYSVPGQDLYVKFGALTAFEMSSNDRASTNPVDVLGSVGLGARFHFTQKADFIIEATYNRGFLEAVHSTAQVDYNQGLLGLIGLSFRI